MGIFETIGCIEGPKVKFICFEPSGCQNTTQFLMVFKKVFGIFALKKSRTIVGFLMITEISGTSVMFMNSSYISAM